MVITMDGNICGKVFGDLLDIDYALIEKSDVIMINLNSVLSPIFYKKFQDSLRISGTSILEFSMVLMDIFSKQFITKYNHKRCIFYYHELNTPHMLQEIYPEWRIRKEHDTKSSISKSVWDTFISVLKSLAKTTSVELYTTEGEHCFIPSLFRLYSNAMNLNILIISRDHLDLTNAGYDKTIVWNGRVAYDKHTTLDRNRLEPSSLGPFMLPYVLLLAGSPKLGYKGVKNMALKKAIKFLMKYKADSLNDISKVTDEKELEIIQSIEKYKPLVVLKDYIKFMSDKGDILYEDVSSNKIKRGTF